MLESDQTPFRPTVADLMLEWVSALVEDNPDRIPLLGVSGAQGIGKTTSLATVRESEGLKVAILSLDDFYLSKPDRLQLAEQVHPLCETRGAPGTHDLDLMKETIGKLRMNGPDHLVNWPRFDKAIDDRGEEASENAFEGMPDAILVEGWLVGAVVSDKLLDPTPINELETNHDPVCVDTLVGTIGHIGLD